MNARPSDEPLDDLDRSILAEFRQTLETADPVPADLDEKVMFALTVQALRAEIAELEQIVPEAAGVRSVDYTRISTVTFTSESMSIVVTTSHLDGETARLDGWVEGAAVEVELRERNRTSTTDVDPDGRFAFPRVERGMIQLIFRDTPGSTAKPVITPSFEV